MVQQASSNTYKAIPFSIKQLINMLISNQSYSFIIIIFLYNKMTLQSDTPAT